jgi:hypothetical protein
MATKRKSKKAHRRHHRAHRMSGVSGTIQTAAFTIVGAAAAKAVSKIIPSSLPAVVQSAIPIAVGVMVPKFVKGPSGQAIGAGMVAVGGLGIIQSFGILKGVGVLPPAVAAVYPRERNFRAGRPLKVAGVNPVNNAPNMTKKVVPMVAGFDESGC